MSTDAPCPCGSNKPINACCGPFVDGWSAAPTAEQLMRSRFAAYSLGRLDYIMSTHAPQTREAVDRDELRRWAANTDFVGLQVVETKAGGPADTTGVVAFVATLVTDGRSYAMFERSRFERHDGRWVYLDGVQDAAG